MWKDTEVIDNQGTEEQDKKPHLEIQNQYAVSGGIET